MPISEHTHISPPISDLTNSPIQKSAFDMAAGIGSDSGSDTDEYVSYLSPGHQQLYKYLDPKYMSKPFDFEGERVTIRQPLKWWKVSLSFSLFTDQLLNYYRLFNMKSQLLLKLPVISLPFLVSASPLSVSSPL